MFRARWISLLLIAACTAGPSSTRAPEDARAANAASPTVPVTSGGSPAPPSPAPNVPPAPKSEPCLAKPVTLQGGHWRWRESKPADPALPRRLASCGSEIDPQGCRFQVAQAHFDAHYYEEAAPIFREIALSEPKNATGAKAGQLYLECLDRLGTHADPPRSTCYDDIGTEAVLLNARHCSPPSTDTKELCSIIDDIDVHSQYLVAENLARDANAGAPDAMSLYRRAGDLFMRLFDRYCAFRRPDKRRNAEPPPGWLNSRSWDPPRRHHCDEVAYSAMRSFEFAKDPSLSERARRALLDPVNQLTATELAKRVAAPR
jgi:hypothetical protein